MPNLSALAPLTTKATALSNLVLVSPQSVVGYQPQNPPNSDGFTTNTQQPPAFLFQYEGEQTVTLESDITDHFVEDNTAVADQIALKPEVYVTRGFIGELNDVTPDFLKPVKFLANKLTTITGYAPGLTTTGLLAYSEAFFLYQVGLNAVNAAVSAWSSIGNLVTGSTGQAVIGSNGLTTDSAFTRVQNKQQTAFQQLYGYWRERRLFTIQTPWAVFQDMAIQRLRAIQDDETNVITDFEVTFKIIRTAKTLTQVGTSAPGNLFQGHAASQAAPNTNLGTSSPVPSTSLSDAITSSGG